MKKTNRKLKEEDQIACKDNLIILQIQIIRVKEDQTVLAIIMGTIIHMLKINKISMHANINSK